MKFLQAAVHNYFPYISLFYLLTVGWLLRAVNISPFKLYPDSYQNIIVAHNLRVYHSVIGHLGENGLVYPYFLGWTRPVYPLLINIFEHINSDEILVAKNIAFFSALAGIIAAYFFLYICFKSNILGIIGALLLSLSFNHVVWGGFILTETLGVLVMLVFFISLFLHIGKRGHYAYLPDFLTGGLLTLAVFTRYEYILLVIPATYVILAGNPAPLPKIINIYSSFLLCSLIVVSQIYPIQPIIQLIHKSLPQYSLALIALVSSIGIISASMYLLSKRENEMLIIKRIIPKVLLILLWSIAVLLILQILFDGIFQFLGYQFTGIKDFFATDFLLGLSTLIGLTYMLREKQYYIYAYTVILTIIPFQVIYYFTNPEMQRYWTHLIPVLLIPASIGIRHLLSLIMNNDSKHVVFRLRYVMLILVIGIFMAQGYATWNGIKQWGNGTWFTKNYEDESAARLAQSVDLNKTPLLLVSRPEPYYHLLKKTTYSINDSPPFVYIPEEFDNKDIVIVDDMGMRQIFPQFSRFIENSLDNYKISQYWVNADYHAGPDYEKESNPVNIYILPLANLKQTINNYIN